MPRGERCLPEPDKLALQQEYVVADNGMKFVLAEAKTIALAHLWEVIEARSEGSRAFTDKWDDCPQ